MLLFFALSATLCFIYLWHGDYVFVGIWLFVYLSRIVHKTAWPIFTKFSGKVAYGPRKKWSDFVGNPDLNLDPRVF